jgi:thymidylate synthase (FAD)
VAVSQILVELQESMGSDASIANAAWTSTYDKDRREDKYDDPAKVEALVRRLARDGHGVPFESVVFRFWIRMPIFTDRQHMTHRLQSANGLSGRYRTMPDDWYEMPEDVYAICDKANIDAEEARDVYIDTCRRAYDRYHDLLFELREGERAENITNAEYKRAREVLRGMLPLAGMVERTSIFNLRSLANYWRLRLSDHAQPEIRQVAEGMLKAVEESGVCPVALSALEEQGWRI